MIKLKKSNTKVSNHKTKRALKNKKRVKDKPYISKFERKQEKIRANIINAALKPIRTNLLNSLDKNILASQQSSDNHRNAV